MTYIVWVFQAGYWRPWCRAPLSYRGASIIAQDAEVRFVGEFIILPLGEEPSLADVLDQAWLGEDSSYA